MTDRAEETDRAVVLALPKVCSPAQVLEVVVPKAREITGVVPPVDWTGYVPVTEVTVPLFCVRQTPLIEKHPAESDRPFAKVEVAFVPVILRYVVLSPEAMVEVALLKMVVVAVPF